MLVNVLITLLIGLAGGWVFTLLNIPLSWLLGSMTAVFIFSKLVKNVQLALPPYFRNIGLIIIGYTIAQSFSKDTVMEIVHQLPSMFLMTISVILFSIFLAFLLTRITGISFRSTLIGSIPGGLSQMLILGEELKNVNLTVVTILQVSRLLSVLFIVPFLVFSPIFNGASSNDGVFSSTSGGNGVEFSWWLYLLLGLAGVSAILAKKIKLPTPYLLGPIIGVGTVAVLMNSIPHIPSIFIVLAQVFLGIYFSFMMDFENSGNPTKFVILSFMTSIVLVLFALVLGVGLMYLHDIQFLTAFISMAPGGMAEMALVGQAIDAQLAIVTGYHLFRILFILFVVPFVLKWILKRDELSNT
ncbi:AbrB family transcriptional regulator [Rossellomorea sp. BNER]|uniref:AbrB family transcriptional regulator n=1 Tax=Rossellomorea sp. BNER TaxID=2962031 RepID=UPI003AF293A1|nr:AbrB family transcriptional regulator [Rossellomorea sp. BNER]